MRNVVTHDAEQPKPFDEQAALAELERLADKIQITRRQRAAAVDEFDAFVRGFREDRHAAARAGQAAAPPSSSASGPAAAAAPQPIDSLPSTRASSASTTAVEPVTLNGAHGFPVAPGRPAPTLRSIAPRAVAAVAALIVLFVIARSLTGRLPATPSGVSPAPAVTAPAAQASSSTGPTGSKAPTASAPAAAVPAAPRRAINIELTTLRPVWTRVIVDDTRLVERELPAGTKIPIGADRAVVIRAGDAGAVRLTVDGKDQGVMGRDGFPATRTFAKSP
jgi:hypothetical protein